VGSSGEAARLPRLLAVLNEAAASEAMGP
jgi:hypothetical protein